MHSIAERLAATKSQLIVNMGTASGAQMRNRANVLAFFASCCLLLCSFLPCVFVHASQNVSGILSSDTTWTRANSPYVLTGTVCVYEGVTLRIEPGVRVEFGSYYIQVNGTLSAKGTNANPIYLVNCDIRFTKRCTSWNEAAGTGSIIEGAIINGTGITINNSLKINNNTFIQNVMVYDPDSIWYRMGLPPSPSSADITIDSGSPTISNNNAPLSYITLGGDDAPTISNNMILGFSCDDRLNSPMKPTITGNTILSNSKVNGSPKFLNNKIYDSVVGFGAGAYTFTENTLRSVTGEAIRIDEDEKYDATPACSVTVTDNYIYFLPDSTPDLTFPGYSNNGIFVYTTGAVEIARNHIFNCQNGIDCFGLSAHATIEQNIIFNCSGSGIYAESGVIQGNAIFNCDTGICAVNTVIRHNTVSYNNIGVDYIDYPNADSSSIEFDYNNIDRNKLYAIANDLNLDIGAQNNWWGTTDTDAINGLIHDFYDDFTLGKVNYTPVLSSPDSQAPTIPTDLSMPILSDDSITEPSAAPPSDRNSPSPIDTEQPENSNSPSDNLTSAVIVAVSSVAIVILFFTILLHEKNIHRKELPLPPPPPPSHFYQGKLN